MHYQSNSDTLYSGQTLYPSQSIQSVQNQFFATIQSDGNFVVYLTSTFQPRNALWSSKTHSSNFQRPFRLTMQHDGNLVIYDQHNRAVWASNTCHKGTCPHRLVMQSDGNLVIYDANSVATWSTGTNSYRIISP